MICGECGYDGGKECILNTGGESIRRCENNIEIDLGKIVCEDGRWMELAQHLVQWRAFTLAVSKLPVLMARSQQFVNIKEANLIRLRENYYTSCNN